MDGLSRRNLLHYAVGATAAGVSAGQGVLDARAPMKSVPTGRLQASNVSNLDGGTDSYQVRSGKNGRRFGIVEDLFRHIQERADVKREVLYWLTDGRSSFLGATSRFQFLEPIIRPLYEKAGIPLQFGFGLGIQESLYRNYSISYANAKGIWQMQWAGKHYGLRGGDYFDVAKSTAKQLEYLSDLVRDFAWNLELVLVDYNYGPGKKFARYRSDQNAFRRISSRLPRETRRYVPRVLAATAIGMDPGRYGVHIPRLDTRTVKVSLERSLHHLELALLLGADHWNLGNLNPKENIRAWFKEKEQVTIPQIYEESYHKRINDHPLRQEFHQFVANVYPAPGQAIQ